MRSPWLTLQSAGGVSYSITSPSAGARSLPAVILQSLVCRCLEVSPDGCPRLKVTGGLLPLNGESALGYRELGYRSIPVVQDEAADWWMRYPNPAIALPCGGDAGFFVLDVDPRHRRVGPKLSVPTCSIPRGGVHYHFLAPTPVPDLSDPGLECLCDAHIAVVSAIPGYKWLNRDLAPRRAYYEREQLLKALRPQRLFCPASDTSQHGDLCRVPSQALGSDIRSEVLP